MAIKFFSDTLEDLLGIGASDTAKEQQERAKEAATQQAQYADEANRLYQEISQKGLDANKASTIASLISQFGLTGAADLVNRQLLNAQQTQSQPTAIARLAALQALPIMQKMAGMTAYKMPTSVTNIDYTSGRPDYASILQAAIKALDSGTSTASSTAEGAANKAYPGVTDEVYQSLMSTLGGTTGDNSSLATSGTALEAYTPEYNYEESPLYQFRKAETEKNMSRAMRAQGYGGSETGALLTARELDKLGAEEAENQWNRIRSIVNIGLGGDGSTGSSGANTSSLTNALTGLSSDVGQTLNNAANQRSNLYQNLATGTAENVGQIGQALAQATANSFTPATGSNLLGTLLKGYQLYTGLGGGNLFGSSWGSGGSGLYTGTTYTPYSGALTYMPSLG